MKHQTVGLQFDFQKSERAKPWKTALPIAGVPLLAAVLLLALKPARESLKCLCNLVFAASEAVNAYAYDYFEVSDAASPVLALGLLVTAAAGVLLLAYLRSSKIVPLLAALALAGGEIWFGLTPPAAVNVLIFALLALLALPVDTLRGRLVFLLAVMAVFLTVQLLAPGVRIGVEEASEHVRDRLDAAEQLVSGADYTPQQEPPQTAREENRLDTETAGETSGDTQNTQDYQHIYEQEQEISRPKRIDYLKNFGFASETEVVAPGINSKVDEVRAAYGLLNLKQVDHAINSRRKVAIRYRDELQGVKGITFFNDIPGVRHNYSYFPIFINAEEYGMTRDELYFKMKEYNVFGRRYFYPLISTFSTYRGLDSANPDNLPVATQMSNNVICLPMHHALSENEVEYILQIIKK